MTLQVNEIFGPTVQGEGAASGRHCLFLRMADCNLRCTWCDTAYTWAFNAELASKLEVPIIHDKAANRKTMQVDEVISELRKLWDIATWPTMLVISGGEPMMQQRDLLPLIQTLTGWGDSIHIETAATITPTLPFDRHVAQYNVSPKLKHSGNIINKRRRWETLEYFAQSPKAWFKFVVRSTEDFPEVDEIVRVAGIDTNRVMVMPEGTSVAQNVDTARRIVDQAIARGYGLSFRTHILLWSDTRGR